MATELIVLYDMMPRLHARLSCNQNILVFDASCGLSQLSFNVLPIFCLGTLASFQKQYMLNSSTILKYLYM